MSIAARLAENKANATKYLGAVVDAMENAESPLRFLKDNDVLVDYICYLSLPPWKKQEFEKEKRQVKLPGTEPK